MTTEENVSYLSGKITMLQSLVSVALMAQFRSTKDRDRMLSTFQDLRAEFEKILEVSEKEDKSRQTIVHLKGQIAIVQHLVENVKSFTENDH